MCGKLARSVVWSTFAPLGKVVRPLNRPSPFLLPIDRQHSAAEPVLIPAVKTAYTLSDTDQLLAYDLPSNEIREISPALYESAMKKLRNKQEIQLLDRISQALHDKTKGFATTEPFHVMAMTLLAKHDAHTPEHEPQTAVSNHRGHFRHRDDRKGGSCRDLRDDPYNNNCLGMCGPKCWCWSIVCDDCCYHKGCYEHDKCCRHKNYSGYCLLPFFHQFGCERYGGYPSCL